MFKDLKQKLRKLFEYFIIIPVSKFKWILYKLKHKKIKIIIGAGTTKFKGWFNTDTYNLDVTSSSDFRKLLKDKKIDAVLAEHVLEHLTSEQLDRMIQNFLNYCHENCNIRIAVPDGYHGNIEYIENVKPNGKGEGAEDHKHLFNYISLSKLFEKYGFKANLLEFWDENKEFNTIYKNDDNGIIRRSFLNDSRNFEGKPNYTSLIIDFKRLVK
ncbi:MAG: hypothetical protein HND52_03760 [Ignavibacteriae bacterium]|nr:hypothetical protein [Ignavibacteriota bacterium]NOG97072.1 hypothetical protein [Ignavibacteriota bacterium]